MPLIRDFKTVFFPASYSTYLLPTHNPPQNTVGRINNRKLYTSSVLRPGCLCPTTSGSGWQPAPRNGIRGERGWKRKWTWVGVGNSFFQYIPPPPPLPARLFTLLHFHRIAASAFYTPSRQQQSSAPLTRMLLLLLLLLFTRDRDCVPRRAPVTMAAGDNDPNCASTTFTLAPKYPLLYVLLTH